MVKRFKGEGRADMTASINPRCEFDYGSYVGANAFIGFDVKLGRGVIVRPTASVASGTEIMPHVEVPAGAYVKAHYRVHAILDAGVDGRGYHMIAALVEYTGSYPWVMPKGKHWRIWAGCRDFTVEQAVEHWTEGANHYLANRYLASYANTAKVMLAKVKYLKTAIKLWRERAGV